MELTISDSDLLVIQVIDGTSVNYPLTYSNFCMINPQTSFPALPDNNVLMDFGYAVFKRTERPSPVQFKHTSEGPIVWDATKDAYTDTWVNIPFTAAEIETAQQNMLIRLRDRCDMLLQTCELQLADVLLTDEKRAEWIAYRQQLQDYMDSVTDAFAPPPWPRRPQS